MLQQRLADTVGGVVSNNFGSGTQFNRYVGSPVATGAYWFVRNTFGPGTPIDTLVNKPFYAVTDAIGRTPLGDPGVIMSLQSSGVTMPLAEAGVTVRWLNGLRAEGLAAEPTVPTIAGRVPINSKYAGQVYNDVRFTEQGFPNFGPYAEARVKLTNLTGNYATDAALANRAVGLPETPPGYVWHHVEDGATMQLIPQDLHNSVRHTGGAAVIRNGGFDQ